MRELINSKDVIFYANTGTKAAAAPTLRSQTSSIGHEGSSARGKSHLTSNQRKSVPAGERTSSAKVVVGEKEIQIYLNKDDISAFNGTDELQNYVALSDEKQPPSGRHTS